MDDTAFPGAASPRRRPRRPASDPAPAALQAVRAFWNAQPCGTDVVAAPRFSAEYFAAVEAHRYRIEPYIHGFAQFTRWHGRKVLEVGIGAATDFTQWVRAGARAYGIDLTPAGVEHARRRLALEGLEAADLRVANAEALPYPAGEFDLVYSWGVLHHTASMERALAEVVRVTRPGGTVKLMLYHRRSLTAAYVWTRWALLRGRPWKSVSWCLAHCVESPGTRAVSRREVRRMLARLGVREARLETVLTHQDRLAGHRGVAWLGRLLSRLAGARFGFFMLVEFAAPAQPPTALRRAVQLPPGGVVR